MTDPTNPHFRIGVLESRLERALWALDRVTANLPHNPLMAEAVAKATLDEIRDQEGRPHGGIDDPADLNPELGYPMGGGYSDVRNENGSHK